MEGGGHGLPLPNSDGVIALGGDHLDARPNALNFGSADEDHFQGGIRKRSTADRAVDLAAVGVAANTDIERAESGLVGVGDLFGEKNRAGTSTERRLEANELRQLGNAPGSENLEN